LDRIDARWRSDFRRMVETGEVSDAFRLYLDSNEQCAAVVQDVLNEQLDAFKLPFDRVANLGMAPTQQRSSGLLRGVITAGLVVALIVSVCATLWMSRQYAEAHDRVEDLRSQLAQRPVGDDEALALFARAWLSSEGPRARSFVADSVDMKWNYLRSQEDAAAAIGELRDYIRIGAAFDYPALDDNDRTALKQTLADAVENLDSRLRQIAPDGRNADEVRNLVGEDTVKLRRAIHPQTVMTYEKADLPGDPK